MIYSSFYHFLYKVFPPYEVRLTIDQTTSFLNDNYPSCKKIILKDAIALAKEAEMTIYCIRIDHVHPYDLALTNIMRVIENHLESGTFNILRGVLIPEGLEMMKVWENASNMLMARGFHSKAQVEENVRRINQIIKNAG